MDCPRFVGPELLDLCIEAPNGEEDGLESRRRSLPRVGVGVIESSMISTHPDVSALFSASGFVGVRFFSFSKSALRLFMLTLGFSGVLVDMPSMEETDDAAAFAA